MDKLVYIYYPVLLVMLLWGSKFFVKRGTWNEEWFSLSQTKALQGFAAICILLHHCGQKTCASWLFPMVIRPGLDPFVKTGYWFVGIFLFCSGYGLLLSYRTKENYLKGFIRKHILPLIVMFYSTGLIFLVVRYLMKEDISKKQLFYYLTGMQLCNPNTWFVIALPIFYLGFYLCFRFCKNENVALVLTCLVVLAYTIIGTRTDHNNFWMRGEWWYNSVHFFSLGLLFARFEKPITKHIKKYYYIYLIAAFALIFVGVRVTTYCQDTYSYYGENFFARDVVYRRWITLLSQMLVSCAFVFFVFLLGLKVKIGNKVLAFIGTITLEFYIIQGLFVELFGYSFLDMREGFKFKSVWYIENVFVFVLVVAACSIPAALLLKRLTILAKGKKRA